MKTENGVWVSANEATELLGVSRATVAREIGRLGPARRTAA